MKNEKNKKRISRIDASSELSHLSKAEKKKPDALLLKDAYLGHRKNSFLKGTIWGCIILALLWIFVEEYQLYKSSQLPYYISLASDFVKARQDKLQITDDKVTILILGKGGGNHEGPELTDTMIFVSIDTKEPKIDLISIPRDMWISELRAKINSAYYWGNKKNPPDGEGLARSTVEKVLGQKISYSVVFDFATFEKVIDIIGGVDVEVENSFADTKYPIAGRENDLCNGDKTYSCRYETISFEKGILHMDGTTALKFSRSRNSEGDEGTDFARGKRQQKIIEAVRTKISSKEVLYDREVLFKLRDTFESEVETDITKDLYGQLGRVIYNAKDSIHDHTFPEPLLKLAPKSKKYDNLYTFIPAGVESDSDWSSVRDWIECVLNTNDEISC